MAKRASSTANTTFQACRMPRQGSSLRRFRGPASRKGGVTACTTTSTGSASCACNHKIERVGALMEILLHSF